jgi:hypothetical protein
VHIIYGRYPTFQKIRSEFQNLTPMKKWKSVRCTLYCDGTVFHSPVNSTAGFLALSLRLRYSFSAVRTDWKVLSIVMQITPI